MNASGPKAKQPPSGAEGAADAVGWRNEVNGVARGPVVQAQTIHGDVRITVDQRQPPPPSPSLLPAAPASELLGRLAGVDRVAAEGGASREVVRLCGGIPLAVCVSGARLAAHPRWPVSRIARELAAEHARLSALSLPGDLSVRAAFDASYQALPGQVALLYRTVAVIPGPDFSADLAAAALNDQKHGQELLDALVDASLLTETSDGRYRQHDLVRLHAQEQTGTGTAVGKHEVIARSVDWYLRKAIAADLVVLPGRWRLGPLYEQESAGRPAYASPAEAARWLESRLPGLLAAVHAAHDAGLHSQAWQLCEALWGSPAVREALCGVA